VKLSTSKYKDFLSRNYDFMCIRSYLRLVRGSHSLFVTFAGKTDVKRVRNLDEEGQGHGRFNELPTRPLIFTP